MSYFLKLTGVAYIKDSFTRSFYRQILHLDSVETNRF